MISHSVIFTFCAAIATSVMFFSGFYSAGAGLLAVFPLFLLGFSYGVKQAAQAVLIACIMNLLFSDIGTMIFFLSFVALPALHVIRKSLLFREHEEKTYWYPLLTILAELTLIAATLFMAISLLAHLEGLGGLQIQVSSEMAANFKELNPDMADMMKKLTLEWSFLIFAFSGWAWVLLLYGIAVMANMLLASRSMALRSDLRLTSQGLPLWLPGILALSILLLFIGNENDHFEGQTLFLLLLLPYFLAGIAWLHQVSMLWKGRKLWLFFAYITLFAFVWPALLFVGLGLYVHLVEILDKPHRIG